MNQQVINEESSHKHFGLIFSSDCNWHEHIDYVKTKAWSRINVMRKLKIQLDRKSLETIYFSFIRPLLEYANVVWNYCTQYESNELEKSRTRLPASSRVRRNLRHSIHCTLTRTGKVSRLEGKKHKLIFYYKMQHGITPEYLSPLVTPTVGSTARYPLRNESDLQTVPAKSQQYLNSFLPSVTRAWNGLPEDIKFAQTITTFKYKLNRNLNKHPAYYFSGTRLGQICHTRLRLSCSSLHHHLFLKNIINDPLCEYGAVEDTKHFFLICNRFRNLRHVLLNTISTFCQPTLEVILYGSTDISVEENKQIFLTVHEFI